MLTVAKIRGTLAQARKGKNKAVQAHSGGRGGGSLSLRARGTATGTPQAEWFAEWYADGKRRRLLVDRVDVAAIEDPAQREKALLHLEGVLARFTEISHMIRAGQDPKVEMERREQERLDAERRERERGTVADLLTAYVEHLKEQGKRSWQVVERALVAGKYAAVKELGPDRKAAEITPRDVQRILKAAHKRGPSMAAHLRSYLHSAFGFGLGSEFSYTRPKSDVRFELTVNPVTAVPRDREAFKAGERVLTPGEVGRIWHEMPQAVEQETGLAFKLLLATGGQRPSEVLHASKKEFDLDRAIWTLPANRTKNGREHVIPLTDRALALVAEAMRVAGDAPWLFPKRRDPSEPMPTTSLRQAAARWCRQVGMTPWTPRDIRRTARTWLSDVGMDEGALDRHFNHGLGLNVGVRHYDRAQRLEEKRGVMGRWDRLLANATGEGPEPGKVVEFKRVGERG